ncbi:MAG TPA: hypothetical protein VK171_05910 [Fimbriimonas sp.]|nr:hypothetical protein [Fimbriimonas sp.]
MSNKKAPKTLTQKLMLTAVFAIPFCLIGYLLFRLIPLLGVLQEADKLSARIERAKAVGFVLSADELQPKGVSDADNGYITLTTAFGFTDKFATPKIRQLDYFTGFEAKVLPKEVVEEIAKAKLVAAKTKYDAKRDYDLGYEMLFPDMSALKYVVKLLCYDALHQARKGDAARAIESLQHAKNVLGLIKQDQSMVAGLVTFSCAGTLFRNASWVAYDLRDNTTACKQIREFIQSTEPSFPFLTSMKAEFYSGLALARNYTGFEDSMKILGGKIEDEEAIEESQKGRNLVREGMPQSAVASGLFSALVDHQLKVYDLATNKDLRPYEFLRALEELESNIEMSFRTAWVNSAGFGISTQVGGDLRTRSYQDLAAWAAQIMETYGSKFPVALPPRDQSIYPGKLSYSKTQKGFVVYSWGEDGKDGGAPTFTPEGKANFNGDDFGLSFPMPPSR